MADLRIPLKAIALPGGAFALFLAAWQAAVATGMTPATIASPSRIARTIAGQWDMLWFHLEPTLLTAVIGYLAAALTALSLGFLVHSVRRIETSVLTIG